MIAHVVLRKHEKEEIAKKVFDTLFEQLQEPITVKLFTEHAFERVKHLYHKKTMMAYLLANMEKSRKIQRVQLKEGRKRELMYAPLTISIPHDQRNWETFNERQEKQQHIKNQVPSITLEDYAFYLSMITTEYTKTEGKSNPKRMPIYGAIQDQTKEYKRFCDLVIPCLNILEEKQKRVFIHRIGLMDNEPLSLTQMAKHSEMSYTEISDAFVYALGKIKRLLKSSIK